MKFETSFKLMADEEQFWFVKYSVTSFGRVDYETMIAVMFNLVASFIGRLQKLYFGWKFNLHC